jgi:hypothetical protein
VFFFMLAAVRNAHRDEVRYTAARADAQWHAGRAGRAWTNRRRR